MTFEYIILNENKEPTHKFRNGGKAWHEVMNERNLAMIVPNGFVVLDFDTESDARIIKEIVNTLNLPVRMMQTTRGVHVWFKMPEGVSLKSGIKQRLAIGIFSDRKSGGRNSYVKIRGGGVDREWIRATNYEDCMPLPRWLFPVSGVGDGFNFKGWKSGSGRNQGLFNYILTLQSKGFMREEIRETIRIINQFVFAESLSDEEMSKILRDESFKPDEVVQKEQAERAASRGFSHNDFADELISLYHIITYNDVLYIYENGYYQADERVIEQKMIELFPSIKQKQRSEVLAYIRIKTHVSSGNLKFDPWIVNLESGRFDLRTMDLSSHTPEIIEFDRIPVIYDPKAYCEPLDRTLNKVFCGDMEVRQLFEEMLAYVLMRHVEYQKAFMFYGSGANGKSTILDLIKAFIGTRNFVSIDLSDLTRKFANAELEHKLANIGDDINNRDLKDTGTLKKIITGNSIQVERKGQTPFQLISYATQIFSCNEIPRSLIDTTDGFYRRWCFIPLNAKFTQYDPDYDPFIKDKIVTPEALSYLFNLAIEGAHRLIERKRFVEPAIVKKALDQYKIGNSSALQWIDELGIEIGYILSTPAPDLYQKFLAWCSENNVDKVSSQAFGKTIRNVFDLESTLQQRASGKRYYRVKLEE